MYLTDTMKSSQTAYVILGLLSIESRQSGYDMRRTIQGSVGYFWGESYGQIYPTLRRLTAEGLITPHGQAAKGRPATAPAIPSVNGNGVQRCNVSMTAMRYARRSLSVACSD